MAPLPSGPIVILENGAHTIKCGVLPSASSHSSSSSSSNPSTAASAATSHSSYADPRIIPNACVRPRTMPAPPESSSNGSSSNTNSRWLIGHEISDALARDALDYAGMQYRLPFEKGFLTDWDAQKAVWDGLFSVSSSSSSSSSSSFPSSRQGRTGPLSPNGIDTTTATLLVTEPYFNLPNMQDTYDQIVFEEYEFAACWRGVPAALIPHGSLFASNPPSSSSTGTLPTNAVKPQCTLIVDAGFSYTHVVPIVDGRIVWQAVKRCTPERMPCIESNRGYTLHGVRLEQTYLHPRDIDAGGKLLTNVLKEQLSYRQWNMMAETFIVQEVKEQCCFVAASDQGRARFGAAKFVAAQDAVEMGGGGGGVDEWDFGECMERCRADPSPLTNPIVQEYVLPDLAAGKKGYVRGKQPGKSSDALGGRDRDRGEQVLVMGVERFSVPEVLFRPDDIGLAQSGLAPTIAHAISCLPAPLKPFAGMFWAHIGLVGGCTKFPGFKKRLEAELRRQAPVGCVVGLWGGETEGTDDPITTAYRAACSFVSPSSKSKDAPSTPSSYPSFAQQTLSRAEYLEVGGGSAAARRRFLSADWTGAPEENWRRRMDEAFGAHADDEDGDEDMWDVDGERDGGLGDEDDGTELGVSSRWRTRTRSVSYDDDNGHVREVRGRQEEEDEEDEDDEVRAWREKEERRKAARRKRDADRKARLLAEAAASAADGDGANSGTPEADTPDQSAVSAKGKPGPKGGAKGKGKGKAKEQEEVSATPAPASTPSAATPRPRLRSTRAGAADSDANASGRLRSGGGDVQMGDATQKS